MASKSYQNIIDEISKMTVLELNELVKALEEALGVSAAMPMAAAPSAGAGAEAGAKKEEEKTEYKVELQKLADDKNKINVIKALRTVTTLELVKAKQAVEEAPTVIAEGVSKDDAMKIKDAIEKAGGSVKLS